MLDAKVSNFFKLYSDWPGGNSNFCGLKQSCRFIGGPAHYIFLNPARYLTYIFCEKMVIQYDTRGEGNFANDLRTFLHHHHCAPSSGVRVGSMDKSSSIDCLHNFLFSARLYSKVIFVALLSPLSANFIVSSNQIVFLRPRPVLP